MSKTMRRRVGTFLLAPDEQLILATNGKKGFSSFDAELADNESPDERAYHLLLEQSNLIITSRDLLPMEPFTFIEDGESIQCLYFYVSQVEGRQLKVQSGRELIILSMGDAIDEAPMHPATKQMLRILSEMPLITRNDVTRVYGKAAGSALAKA